MDQDTRLAIEARLKRAAGQVAGVQRMVDEQRYCVDVLTQIAAARAALARVGKLLLDSHVRSCVRQAFERDDPADRDTKIDELLRLFDKNCNC